MVDRQEVYIAMHVEYPITENHVYPFRGLHCGVILNDGSTHYGVVTGCERGKLLLNGQSAGEAAGLKSSKKKGKKSLSTASKPKKTARTRADLPELPFFPDSPLRTIPKGKPAAFNLESISVLYAIFP